ncbi:MAG: glycerate kinase [Bacteroidales bacterium]|nr:glycerate kinase [Bacteroidales bacterium]
MKILIAPDKFKGCLTAEEVTEAIVEGLHAVDPSIEVIPFPLADGGDGTAQILTKHMNGRMVEAVVHDPLLRSINATYGISGDGLSAFIEMSAASGLRLLTEEERDCTLTTSLGTGELIRDAIHRGARKILLGIGGSATNDAGIGMASALGYSFADKNGTHLEPVGKNLVRIAGIDDSNLFFFLEEIEVTVACDVENPLYGENGAAYVYAPQKGANPEQVKDLDNGLRNFAEVVDSKYNRDINTFPGAGAAGGMGAGAMIFLNAKLVNGIKMVMDQTNFAEQVNRADVIITGEGRMDDQTFKGKVVDGVCRQASSRNKKVIAICGQVRLEKEALKNQPLSHCFSIEDHAGEVNLDPEVTRKNIIELINRYSMKII